MFDSNSSLVAVGFMGTDTLISALWITGIIVAAYMLVMWIALILWVYRDIESRSVDQFTRTMLTGMVAVFNIPGVLLYLALRPSEPLVESYNRQLEMEAFLHEMRREDVCPACQRSVEASFVACPYCKATLQSPCGDCGRNLKPFWAVCPYCGGEPERSAVAATTPRPAATAWQQREIRPAVGPAREARKPVTTVTHPAS